MNQVFSVSLKRATGPTCALSFLLALMCMLDAAVSHGQSDGISIAVVVAGKDTPSYQQAMVVNQIAKQGFERNPRFSLVDMEAILNNGPPTAMLARLRNAEGALERGMAAYDAFELEPALEAFAEAAIGFEQSVSGLTDFSLLVDVYRYQGASYALQGDSESALRSFSQALVIDPDTSLVDGSFPDTVQALFEAARQEVSQKQTGSLSVFAAPSAAEVWVNGVFRGSAPIEVSGLTQGRHYVKLVRAGYVSYGEAVDVTAGNEDTLQATLRPTVQLSNFDQLTAQLVAGDARAPGELAALFKVDQLFWATVEENGGNLLVNGYLTNGVTGELLLSANRTFTVSSHKYRVDLESWLAENFRRSVDASSSAQQNANTATNNGGDSFLPDAPEGPPTPGILISGYIVTPLSVLPLLAGLGSGLYSFYSWDYYRNQGTIFAPVRALLEMEQAGLNNQIESENENARLIFFLFGASSIFADLSYVVSGIGFAAGITMIIIGLNQKAQIQDVLVYNDTNKKPMRALASKLNRIKRPLAGIDLLNPLEWEE